MTFKEVAEMIESIGFPYAYYQFPEDEASDPPFICYFYEQNNDMYADDQNYQKIESLIIELYTETKDFDSESAVETVLASNELTWSREETPIDSERLYEVIYSLDVIITEE